MSFALVHSLREGAYPSFQSPSEFRILEFLTVSRVSHDAASGCDTQAHASSTSTETCRQQECVYDWTKTRLLSIGEVPLVAEAEVRGCGDVQEQLVCNGVLVSVRARPPYYRCVCSSSVSSVRDQTLTATTAYRVVPLRSDQVVDNRGGVLREALQTRH